MKEVEFEVKGKAAVAIVLVAFLWAVLGHRADLASFDAHGKEAIKYHLYVGYLRHGMPSLSREIDSGAPEHQLTESIGMFLDQKNIELGQVDLQKDPYSHEIYIARVEIESVNDGAPPDGRTVRYLEMRRQFGDWIVERDTYQGRFRESWWDLLF